MARRDGRRVKQVKKNRETGLRSIKGAGANFVSENVTGNLVRTDAKVGSMPAYINYASTDSVPYFVSTLSRYNALVGKKSTIVDRATSKYKTADTSPIVEIGKALEKKEASLLADGLGALWPDDSSDPDRLVLNLNEITTKSSSLSGTMSEIVTEASQAVQTAFFKYLITDKGAAAQIEAYLPLSLHDPKAFSEIKFDVQDLEDSIGYRDNIPKEFHAADNLIKAVNGFVKIFDDNEIEMSDLGTIKKAISSMTLTLSRSVAQRGKGRGVNQKQYVGLMNDLNRIERRVIKKYNEGAGGLGLDRGYFTSGNYGEVLSAGLIADTLRKVASSVYINQQNAGKSTAEAQEILQSIGVSLASGEGNVKNKTVDLIFRVGGQSYTTDVKTHSHKKQIAYSGLVYESTMQMDFKESFDSLMRSGNLPSSVMRMYRAYILNVGMNDGYSISNLKEKEMYIQEYLKTKKGFDYKFHSEALETKTGNPYPILVQINGKFFRFSEVLKSMTNPDDFFGTTSTKGALHVASPKNIQSYGQSAQALYMNKIRTGSVAGKDGQNRSLNMPGFAAMVSGMSEMAQSVESTYFEGNSSQSVNFKIALRK